MSTAVGTVFAYNQPKGNLLKKIVAPALIGSALVFGGKVSASDVEKPVAEESQVVAVEESTPEQINSIAEEINSVAHIFFTAAILKAYVDHKREERSKKTII